MYAGKNLYNSYVIVNVLWTWDATMGNFNPLDAGRRSTDFAQTPYAAGSLLTDGTVYERSGW